MLEKRYSRYLYHPVELKYSRRPINNKQTYQNFFSTLSLDPPGTKLVEIGSSPHPPPRQLTKQ
jgi:hypothetical protein